MALAMVSVAAVVSRRARDARLGPAFARAAGAATVGVAVAFILGPAYGNAVQTTARSVTAIGGSVVPDAVVIADPQQALGFLPAFQIGLFAALAVAAAVRWGIRRWAVAIGVLAASEVALLVVVGAFDLSGVLPVPGLRAWAVVVPALLLFVTNRSSVPTASGAYHRFWDRVGREFPDLGGAASTAFYFENERRLFLEHVPHLEGLRVLKTDLWDEARNTRILQWVEAQGAEVHGVDISLPTAALARREFRGRPVGATGADVRQLPFGNDVFDVVYSMGTIEHFPESQAAVAEMHRVLAPDGVAIVGVPNRLDPFLRPALAWAMQRLGAYDYGEERSFTRRQLRELLEGEGFEVLAEPAILFIPGWLRMLDLACHAWCRPLAPVVGQAVALFAWLDRYVPAVRRHGYLLATVVRKRKRSEC